MPEHSIIDMRCRQRAMLRADVKCYQELMMPVENDAAHLCRRRRVGRRVSVRHELPLYGDGRNLSGRYYRHYFERSRHYAQIIGEPARRQERESRSYYALNMALPQRGRHGASASSDVI